MHGHDKYSTWIYTPTNSTIRNSTNNTDWDGEEDKQKTTKSNTYVTCEMTCGLYLVAGQRGSLALLACDGRQIAGIQCIRVYVLSCGAAYVEGIVV